MSKIIFSLILSFSSLAAFAQPNFLKVCEKQLDAPILYREDITWLFQRFAPTDCKQILEKLKQFKSFDQIALKKLDTYVPQGWTTSFDYLKGNESQTSYDNIVRESNNRETYLWNMDDIRRNKEKPRFTNLEFYSFLTNITHLTYSKDYPFADNYSLCSVLKIFKSLKTISIDQELLTPEVDKCMIQAKITGIILRKEVSTFKSFVPKTNIIGIERYTGDLKELTGFTRLMYLGMTEKKSANGDDSDNLKLLLQIPALTHFDLKTPNLKNSSNIKYLESLTWLRIKCHGDEACRTSDTSFSFLKSLEYLAYLDLSNNGLTHIEEFSTIKTLLDLKELNLSGNSLVSLPTFTLPKIQNINLGGNELINIDGLKGIMTLGTLNLSSNKLSDLSVASKLFGLQELNISNNLYRSSFDDMQPMPHLKVLSINGGCHYSQGMESSMDSKYRPQVFDTDFVIRKLVIIPEPKYPEIDWSKIPNRNGAPGYDNSYYDPTPELGTGPQEEDLSGYDLPGLNEDEYYGHEDAFGRNDTAEARMMRERQAENKKVKQAPAFVADGIDLSKFKNLVALSMRCNKQSTLPNLETLKDLRFLDMDGNAVRSVDSKKSDSLVIIRLNRNDLREMPIFINFTALKTIDLSYNQLSDVTKALHIPNKYVTLGLRGNSFTDFRPLNHQGFAGYTFDLSLNNVPAKKCPNGYDQNATENYCVLKPWTPPEPQTTFYP